MDNLDYYTVMESRIKYFSLKYDPQNKLGNFSKPTLRIQPTAPPVVVKRPHPKKKILEKLDSVIALFL
jgi:hypothetical protein